MGQRYIHHYKVLARFRQKMATEDTIQHLYRERNEKRRGWNIHPKGPIIEPIPMQNDHKQHWTLGWERTEKNGGCWTHSELQ